MNASEYHIHIDAQWLSMECERFLKDTLGFWRMDFLRERPGDSHHAPNHHLTLKLADAQPFKDAYRQIEEFIAGGDALIGYVEGEYVALDIAIPPQEFDRGVPAPFTVQFERLPPGSFRESEIHVTMHRDASDPQLRSKLNEMGFHSALLPQSYGIGQVFTLQGARHTISELLPPLLELLNAAGGCSFGSVKEERIVKYWVSDPLIPLPPVVGAVKWYPSRSAIS